MIVRFMAGQKKKQDKLIAHGLQRTSNALLTLGIIGLFRFFSSFERVQLFGARILFLALAISAIVWAVFLLRYFLRELPMRRAQHSDHRVQDKYLPHHH